MQLQAERFDEQFERFKSLIRAASGQDFAGFNEGLAAEWEEYKLPLRQTALTRLDLEHWKPDTIGNGELLEAAIRLKSRTRKRARRTTWCAGKTSSATRADPTGLCWMRDSMPSQGRNLTTGFSASSVVTKTSLLPLKISVSLREIDMISLHISSI
jgi:hypothetical protein